MAENPNKLKYDEDFTPINDTPENIARTLFVQPVKASEKSTEQLLRDGVKDGY